MHFEGADALNIEQTVTKVLVDFLNAEFAKEPHLTTFAKWAPPGGVGVRAVNADDPQVWNAAAIGSKRPTVSISIPDGQHETSLWRAVIDDQYRRGTHHTLDVIAEIMLFDAAQPAFGLLRDALRDIVKKGERALYELGLEEITIEPDKGKYAGRELVNPHVITCHVYSL